MERFTLLLFNTKLNTRRRIIKNHGLNVKKETEKVMEKEMEKERTVKRRNNANKTHKMRKIFLFLIPFLPIILFAAGMDDRGFLLTLTSALIHEAGHILSAAFLGVELSSFKLSLGGAVIKTGGYIKSTAAELAILLSGCAVNFFAFLVFYKAWSEFAAVNLALCIFNLLPVCGLDGGEILKCILQRYLPPGKAHGINAFVNSVFLFAIGFFGMFSLIFSQGNPSLFLIFFALFYRFALSEM